LERYLQYASVVRHWDQVPAEDVERAVGCFFPVAEKLQEELKDIAETDENWVINLDYYLLIKHLFRLIDFGLKPCTCVHVIQLR
jgi:hypothetical protein